MGNCLHFLRAHFLHSFLVVCQNNSIIYNKPGGDEMIRFAALLAVVIGVSVIVTFLFHFLFRKWKFVKYLPALAALLGGIYNIYLAGTVNVTGFQDIAHSILALMCFAAFVSGAVAGVTLDMLKK
jgi:hypothetical protein